MYDEHHPTFGMLDVADLYGRKLIERVDENER